MMLLPYIIIYYWSTEHLETARCVGSTYLLMSLIYIVHVKNLNDLELILNQELHAVAEWMKSNRRALSILKTNFVLFHSKKLKPYKSLNLKIDGVNIQEVSTVKYLGVTSDLNLTWKNHVNELCLKLSNTVGVFSK